MSEVAQRSFTGDALAGKVPPSIRVVSWALGGHPSLSTELTSQVQGGHCREAEPGGARACGGGQRASQGAEVGIGGLWRVLSEEAPEMGRGRAPFPLHLRWQLHTDLGPGLGVPGGGSPGWAGVKEAQRLGGPPPPGPVFPGLSAASPQGMPGLESWTEPQAGVFRPAPGWGLVGPKAFRRPARPQGQLPSGRGREKSRPTPPAAPLVSPHEAACPSACPHPQHLPSWATPLPPSPSGVSFTAQPCEVGSLPLPFTEKQQRKWGHRGGYHSMWPPSRPQSPPLLPSGAMELSPGLGPHGQEAPAGRGCVTEMLVEVAQTLGVPQPPPARHSPT